MLDDAHGIVEGEQADEAPLAVDDGERNEARLCEPSRSALGVFGRLDALRLAHDRGDDLVGPGRDKVAQAHHSGDVPGVVEHGQKIDRLGVIDAIPEAGKRLVDGVVHPRRDVLGRHAAADRVLRVAEHDRGEPALALGEAVQEFWREGRGKLVEQPHAIVWIESLEYLGDLGVA